MGLIMLMGPDESWRPTYEPSREREFSIAPAKPVIAYRIFISQLSSEWNVPIVGNDQLGAFAQGTGIHVPRPLRPVAPKS